MDDRLLKRVCADMLNKNGSQWEGMVPVPRDDMIQKMRDPENLVDFLSLFYDAIDARHAACIGKISDCDKCAPSGDLCPRAYLKSLYHPEKYRIILKLKETPAHTVRQILPGEFTKDQAQKIIDAYNSPDYTMEEIK